ncbi:MAG: diguanylate cyclase [Candidatus Omnitrophica bacterium]|nr:diguanylate cyclase [Candidatus Omnitrophota bacterium]
MRRSAVSPVVKALLAGIAAAAFYSGVAQPFRIFEISQLKTQDLFFAARHLIPRTNPLLKDIFLIVVDDESIDRVQERWPFRRRVYAELIEKASAAKPRAIGLDFVFAGKGEPLDDYLLSEAIQDSGNVILAAFVDPEGNLLMSLKEIRKGAQGSGVVNKLLDKDLYVRRAKLFYRDQAGKVVAWPWEIELLIQLLGLDRESFRILGRGVSFKSLKDGGEVYIPFHNRQDTAINYRVNLEDVPHLPFWKAMESKDLASMIEGKILLSGANSRGLHDYYQTPLGMMPGVVVNLNLLLNILSGDFLHRLPPAADSFIVSLFVFLATWMGVKFDVLRATGMMTVVTALIWAVFFAFFCFNLTGDYFTPFLAGWVSFIGITFYRYFHTFIENIRLRGEVVTDPLTGLYNRRFLESRIDTELAKLASEKRGRKTDELHELSVLMLDIDNFKKINDTYGHQFGDDVIRSVSFSIRESTRKDDIAARFGGEEFCVVLNHTNRGQAIQIAEKIRASVEGKKFSYVNQMAQFTVSVGVATAREDNLLSSRALIRGADLALYEAKKTGKNKVCIYQHQNAHE